MSHPIVDAQTERLTAAEAALAAAEARERDLQQRLVALVTASGTLFGSPDLADMMPAVVVLARTLLPADGYAVWRHDHESGTWYIGASSGVSEAFSQRVIDMHRGHKVAPVPFTDPFIAEEVDKVPMLEERLATYREEGIVDELLSTLAKIAAKDPRRAAL